MTGSYTRRGFLGLQRWPRRLASQPAPVGAPSGSSRRGTSAPASNNLRVFTYEGDETIDLFKAQIDKFDAQAGTTTTVDSLPGSGAAVYPDKLRTELLGGKGPDVWRIWGGQIGAPFVKAKQAMDLAPYYQKFGWDSRINTTAIEGMTFEGVKGGVPFISLGIGCLVQQGRVQEGGHCRRRPRVTPRWRSQREARGRRDNPAGRAVSTAGTSCGSSSTSWRPRPGRSCTTNCLPAQESWDRPEVVTAFTNFKKWQDKKWLPDGALGLDPLISSPRTSKARRRTRSPGLGPRRRRSRRPRRTPPISASSSCRPTRPRFDTRASSRVT